MLIEKHFWATAQQFLMEYGPDIWLSFLDFFLSGANKRDEISADDILPRLMSVY